MPSISPRPVTQAVTPFLQRVRQNAAIAFNLKAMPIEDKVLFWSSFMYVPSSILSPFMTDWQVRHTKMPSYEKNLVVKTEIARQVIGSATHFLGFFGGILLFGFGKKKPKTFQKLGIAVLGATFSYAFIRPLLVNAYTARWVAKNRPEFLVSRAFFSVPPSQSHPPLSPTASLHAYHSIKPLLFNASAGRGTSSEANRQASTKPPNTLAMA